MPFTYDYARPAITADIVVFAQATPTYPTSILLIKRKFEPFKDCWALPGGFVEIAKDETWYNAAVRELTEETSISEEICSKLQPVGIFDAPNRDPRGRVIAQAFYTVIGYYDMSKPVAKDDASELKWFFLDDLPDLAFDHDQIITKAKLKYLKGWV